MPPPHSHLVSDSHILTCLARNFPMGNLFSAIVKRKSISKGLWSYPSHLLPWVSYNSLTTTMSLARISFQQNTHKTTSNSDLMNLASPAGDMPVITADCKNIFNALAAVKKAAWPRMRRETSKVEDVAIWIILRIPAIRGCFTMVLGPRERTGAYLALR